MSVRLKAFVASVFALAAVVFIAYFASDELAIEQFFLAPVVIAAWFGGRRAAWGMAAAASAAWLGVSYSAAHPYLHEYNRYWNLALIVIRLIVAGTVVAVFREALASAKKNLEEKEAALAALQKSTADFRSLEGRFQTICAWTNQIRDGDEWISFPEFLTRHLNATVTHGISPQATEELNAGSKPGSPPSIPRTRVDA
jgi:hypothetical protein